jgi:hypothetical protein
MLIYPYRNELEILILNVRILMSTYKSKHVAALSSDES